jgi:hypothetical protein
VINLRNLLGAFGIEGIPIGCGRETATNVTRTRVVAMARAAREWRSAMVKVAARWR